MDKKIIAIVIIVVFAAFASGFFIGIKLNKFQPVNAPGFSAKNDPGGIQAGWDAAKKRLAESGFVSQNVNNPIKQVSGTVKEIKGNSVVLTIQPLEPLADPALDERIIEIDYNTKVYLMAQRDAKELAKAIEEFSKKIQAQAGKPLPSGTGTTTNNLTPPESFTKKPAKLADIKAGSQINVTAQGEDIKTIKNFKAAEITIF
jgi:hypothetical protein